MDRTPAPSPWRMWYSPVSRELRCVLMYRGFSIQSLQINALRIWTIVRVDDRCQYITVRKPSTIKPFRLRRDADAAVSALTLCVVRTES